MSNGQPAAEAGPFPLGDCMLEDSVSDVTAKFITLHRLRFRVTIPVAISRFVVPFTRTDGK